VARVAIRDAHAAERNLGAAVAADHDPLAIQIQTVDAGGVELGGRNSKARPGLDRRRTGRHCPGCEQDCRGQGDEWSDDRPADPALSVGHHWGGSCVVVCV
jgi:hypothetical protein